MPDIGLLQYQSEGTVPLPVMPSGVEHRENPAGLGFLLCSPSPATPPAFPWPGSSLARLDGGWAWAAA